MKRILNLILSLVPIFVSAQTAIDAYNLSQTELKGTARYMSMAGAYSALGGDISSLNHNPGGIGVYRSSDVALTLNLDLQSVQSNGNGLISKINQTKFDCNNFGYVGSFRLDSDIMPFINFGFSYNRPMSLNRRYGGKISDIKTSLTDRVAWASDGYTSGDLDFGSDGYNPYIDSYAPWLGIMANRVRIINPIGKNYLGLMNDNTYGFSDYEVIEEGGVDEFTMNFGGNVVEKLFWGISVGITNIDYNKYTYYGEALTNANVIKSDQREIGEGDASWGLENWLTTTGSGWNFKFGLIYKPINELRIGVSIHTPTYWSLKDVAFSSMNSKTIAQNGFTYEHSEDANTGYVDEIDYKVKSPWKFNVSVAAVIGSRAIVSTEYERTAYNDMNMEYYVGYNRYEQDALVSRSFKDYYQAMNTYRIGVEYRLIPQVSLRVGYAYQSSPISDDAMNNQIDIITAGTTPAYTFDKSTRYITGGVGYRYKAFYTDLAYVNKSRESVYNAFSDVDYDTPKASIKDSNNQVVWTIGYRF